MSPPANGSGPDPARRRNALLLGLEQDLTAAQVQTALQLWDDEYARTRPAALAEYVARVTSRFGLDVRASHALRISVYTAIAKHDVRQGGALPIGTAPPQSLPPVSRKTPMMPAAAATPSTTAKPPPLSATYTVFSSMAATIAGGIRREPGDAKDEFVSSIVRSADIADMGKTHANAVSRWALSGNPADLAVLSTLTAANFRSLMHAIYVAAVEACGPIAADRLLARAVQIADVLPEASRFSPRELL